MQRQVDEQRFGELLTSFEQLKGKANQQKQADDEKLAQTINVASERIRAAQAQRTNTSRPRANNQRSQNTPAPHSKTIGEIRARRAQAPNNDNEKENENEKQERDENIIFLRVKLHNELRARLKTLAKCKFDFVTNCL